MDIEIGDELICYSFAPHIIIIYGHRVQYIHREIEHTDNLLIYA